MKPTIKCVLETLRVDGDTEPLTQINAETAKTLEHGC